ncbi:MAG: hypothetical protein D4S01_10140 [Dehalococcoidia bacterium]|nr:MAG: hypothetical protein D4S01_10140 [Dehalococcoidia bacterium]
MGRLIEGTLPRIAEALEALAKKLPNAEAPEEGIYISGHGGKTFITYETFVEYEQTNRDELAQTLGCGNSWREIQQAAAKAVKNG